MAQYLPRFAVRERKRFCLIFYAECDFKVVAVLRFGP